MRFYKKSVGESVLEFIVDLIETIFEIILDL